MITEDYVSYEVAKLLKEKGFDESCQKCYYVSTKSIEDVHNGRNTILSSFFISCPTLQMACKWLREVNYLHICVQPLVECGYTAYIYDVADKYDYGIIQGIPHHKTYEEAVEAAIKYVLENLI